MQSLKPLKLNRAELVETLEELTRQLKTGRLAYEDRQWTVPEKIQAQIDLKEKKGRFIKIGLLEKQGSSHPVWYFDNHAKSGVST